MSIESMFTSVSIVGMAIAALAYLAKSLTTHFLDRDLRSYEIALKAESDRILEAFKADLALASREREIVLAAIQERRITVIAETYSLLDDVTQGLNNVASAYLGVEEIDAAKESEFAGALIALLRFHRKNAIWLEPTTADRIFSFFVNAMIPAIVRDQEGMDIVRPNMEPMTEDAVRRMITSCRAEVKSLRTTLEEDFRAALGVTVPDSVQ